MSRGLVKIMFFYFLMVMVESFSLPSKIKNSVVMLENETHVYCVGEKYVDQPIFITPPRPEIQNSINLIRPEFWKSDDWQIKNSTELLTEPVLDRRWEDLLFSHTTNKAFVSPVSVSFSIFGQTEFHLYVDNNDELDYLKIETEKSNDWNNFVIFTQNGNIYYKQNNIHFHTTENMVPAKIVIKSDKEMYTKVHEYKYVEATRPSEDVTYYLTIPPMGKSLLTLYTSLCRFCILDVIVDEKVYSISSNIKENSTLNEWQSHQFKIKPDAETQIQLIRKLNGKEDKPFWALDARLYDNEINTVVYQVDIADETQYGQYSCTYLEDQVKEKENENVRKKRNSDNYERCPAGMLGQNCDIDCKAVLGELYPKCEQHRICMDAMCFCAWGFTGSFCKDGCKSGTWGANCNQQCPSECSPACHSMTGECTNTQHTFYVPVLGGVPVLLVLAIGVLIKRKFVPSLEKRNQQDYLDDEEKGSKAETELLNK